MGAKARDFPPAACIGENITAAKSCELIICGASAYSRDWDYKRIRAIADELGLSYHFVCSWITFTVHSSLEAVGLTAAFSNALSMINNVEFRP